MEEQVEANHAGKLLLVEAGSKKFGGDGADSISFCGSVLPDMLPEPPSQFAFSEHQNACGMVASIFMKWLVFQAQVLVLAFVLMMVVACHRVVHN